MSEKKLFLLDGHALVYRAHYAFINRPLINSKGVNTSAITGFVRTLWDLLNSQNPTHIAVAFDPSGDTFRNERYPEYKANREEQPKDITIAFPYIRSIVEGFNIPIIEVPGFEADDTIGTIAKQAEKEGYTVYMVTPDKDYAQLVSENIFMYKPSRQGNGVEIIGVPEVLDKWDIENVDQVIDVLGLQGDSVDNIPGIPGIGAKTASKLLKQFGSVENLVANTDQLKGKQKENVENFAEQGLLSKELATIKLDVPIEFDEKSYTKDPMNKEALAEIFKELEFRTLADAVLGTNTKSPVQTSLFGKSSEEKTDQKVDSVVANYQVADKNITDVKHNYILVNSEKDMVDLANKLASQKEISFDTETTGIDVHQAELVGLAFSIAPKEAYYVPVPENREEAMKIVEIFRPVLEDPKIKKIGQNIKYDILMMKWYDVEVKGPYFDTMIAHYLSEPDKRHKLDYLSEAYLNYKMVPIEALIGKRGKNQLSMRDIDPEKVSEYAGEDADITYQLRDPLKELLKENELLELYETLEYPLIDVLAAMEFEGVRINPDFLSDYSKVLGDLIKTKEKEIYEKAGSRFNISSPSQVGAVLFDKMGIPYRWRKTSSGKYSTDVDKLTELAEEHDIVNDILEYRKYSKLKSTYVDALPLLINPKTKRVHSSFNQARAATGRLSSENPNLQNIPIKDDAGREIRKAFEPRDKDHILLAADYSQIELRLIAEISEDEGMMEAFLQGLDFHTATAAKIFEVSLEEVTSDQRRTAKTVNFSITYGAGATNLSRQLGIKRSEAKDIIDQYFKQFPGLQNYMVETVEEAKKKGYVSTLMGRRRYLRDINSNSGLARSNAERMAINTPIQGTAADMIKVAMINVHQALKEADMKSKMILQVHDELVFDVYRPEFEKVKEIVEDKMKNALPGLKVPILVGMGSGENWLEAH
ncbi:DNA polymerase I [Portibacter marinus]|uniref:DNA polymerase I n=1 Tax=Portibacter marinus TaxID=2898660 RepID=UPI001F3C43A1|nr:DNA polymerase I [Portibacter marinus]